MVIQRNFIQRVTVEKIILSTSLALPLGVTDE